MDTRSGCCQAPSAGLSVHNSTRRIYHTQPPSPGFQAMPSAPCGRTGSSNGVKPFPDRTLPAHRLRNVTTPAMMGQAASTTRPSVVSPVAQEWDFKIGGSYQRKATDDCRTNHVPNSLLCGVRVARPPNHYRRKPEHGVPRDVPQSGAAGLSVQASGSEGSSTPGNTE